MWSRWTPLGCLPAPWLEQGEAERRWGRHKRRPRTVEHVNDVRWLEHSPALCTTSLHCPRTNDTESPKRGQSLQDPGRLKGMASSGRSDQLSLWHGDLLAGVPSALVEPGWGFEDQDHSHFFPPGALPDIYKQHSEPPTPGTFQKRSPKYGPLAADLSLTTPQRAALSHYSQSLRGVSVRGQDFLTMSPVLWAPHHRAVL